MITNLHKSCKLNKPLVKKIAIRVLKHSPPLKPITLHLIFTDDRAITAMNSRFKGRSRPTDVLAFRINRDDLGKKNDLCEAYISVDRALDYSRLHKSDPGAELVLYIIHAILHLSGYDDTSAKKRKLMRNKQEETLAYLWQQENLSKVLMPR